MRLIKLVSNLGYGSQKDVRAMIRDERLTTLAGVPLGQDARVAHAGILLDGQPLDPPQGMVLMLNKPCGYTCSTSDPGLTVYALLPPRFVRRKPVVATVGRLDRDSSGLLLLTDDGQFLHHVISPRRAIAKTYEVTLARPLRGDEAELFASGALMLRSETEPLLPARFEAKGDLAASVTITEGRYHQIRRMFAAVGNHVETLRRTRIGGLTLDGVEEGRWRSLAPSEIEAVTRT